MGFMVFMAAVAVFMVAVFVMVFVVVGAGISPI